MIFVTGASGFIGRELVKKLYNEREDVTVLLKKQDQSLRVNKVIGDLSDKKLLERMLKGADVVVHLAALVNSADRKKMYESNVIGTKNLLETARKNKVKRFIFFSSAVVTSKISGIYSDSKIEGERLVRKSGLNYTIIRPSLIYGRTDNKNFGGMINLIKKCPVVPIIGTGKAKTQPVYIGDVVDATYKIIKSKKANNSEYFIAGPSTLTMNEMVDMVTKNLSLRRVKLHIPIWMMRFVVFFYERINKKSVIVSEQIKRMNEDKVYGISNAKRDFGYNPVSFKQGLNIFLK